MTEPSDTMSTDGDDTKRLLEIPDKDWRQLVKSITGIEEDVKGLKAQMVALREEVDQKLSAVETTIRDKIASVVIEEVLKQTEVIKNDVEVMGNRVTCVESSQASLQGLAEDLAEANKTERSVFIKGLNLSKIELAEENGDQDPVFKVQFWCVNTLNVECTVVSVKQITPRGNITIPWLKVELASQAQKIELLRAKGKCKNTPTFAKVYISRLKTRDELTIEHNARMVVRLSGRANARVAGNGRILAGVGDNPALP